MKKILLVIVGIVLVDAVFSSVLAILIYSDLPLIYGPPAFYPRFIEIFKEAGLILVGVSVILLIVTALIKYVDE